MTSIVTRRIPLDYPCIFLPRNLGSTGGPNKADSNYHAVVWRPIGGVTDEQIQLLYNQFLEDLGIVGNNKCAERGMFTIEGSGRERHVHIALILTNKAETVVTSSRYKELLGEAALLKACSIEGVKTKHVALRCLQPPTDKMKNYKQTSWLAYTAKEAALNPDFTIEDCNNGNTRRMKFVFDGLEGNALLAAQTRFITAAKTFWHTKLVKNKIIYFTENSMNKLANEFYPIHCPDLPWCPENRAAVLARMYLHKGRYLKYDFASNFFKEKYIKERFALHCHESNFPDQIVAAIQATFDIVENGGRKSIGTKRKKLSNGESSGESNEDLKKRNEELEIMRYDLKKRNEELMAAVYYSMFTPKQKTEDRNPYAGQSRHLIPGWDEPDNTEGGAGHRLDEWEYQYHYKRSITEKDGWKHIVRVMAEVEVNKYIKRNYGKISSFVNPPEPPKSEADLTQYFKNCRPT